MKKHDKVTEPFIQKKACYVTEDGQLDISVEHYGNYEPYLDLTGESNRVRVAMASGRCIIISTIARISIESTESGIAMRFENNPNTPIYLSSLNEAEAIADLIGIEIIKARV